MSKFLLHVGLDFGTKLTKVCVFNTKTEIREFFRFPNGKFYLPSIVTKVKGNKFRYGGLDIEDKIQEYSYFKMASAEDVLFHIDTYERDSMGEKSFYSSLDWKEYSPEFLSVLYLCFVTLIIEDKYKENDSSSSGIGGFLRRFIDGPETLDEYTFTYRMGIPTEWSQKKNILRKRKFENILLISQLLRNEIKSSKQLMDLDIDKLKLKVQYYNDNLIKKNQKELESLLNEKGLSLYPENAAGITSLTKTKQLSPGYYSAMDIGAGTSDVSFFKVLNDNKIKYLASESYLLASNDVYNNFSDIFGTEDSNFLEKCFRELKREDPDYKTELGGTIQSRLVNKSWDFQKLFKRLFAKRVRWFHEKKGIIQEYNDQPVIMYGGGSKFDFIGGGAFLYWGDIDNFIGTQYFVEKTNITEYLNLIETNPSQDELGSELVILVVSLGLSFIQHDRNADWFENDLYSAMDYDKKMEDYRITENQVEVLVYDIFKREWVVS